MKFIDKSCYLEKEKILVIADLHLGYEQGLQEQGVFIPKTQYKKTIDDLEKIFLEINKLNKNKSVNKKTSDNNKGVISESSVNNKNPRIREIIILGDLKHEFASVLQQEWREVLDLLDYLKKKTKKITIIRGNHDNYLINIIKKENIKLVDYYVKDDKAFIHGHKIYPEILDKKIKTIFLGHLHPSIFIAKNVKKEIYKCFLVGKWKDTENLRFSVSQTPHKNKQGVCDKEIIILPSFFPLVEGQDLQIEDTNLAFRLNLSGFKVYVVGDKVYDFGKLRDAGKLV